MSARYELRAALNRAIDEYGNCIYHTEEMIDADLDAYRAEVLAEAADAVAGMRAVESDPYPQKALRGAEMKLRRMADTGGDTPTRGESTEAGPSFFQPGRTYVRDHHGEPILFAVGAVATGPGHTYPTAFGWRKVPGEDWEPSNSDDMGGWTALDLGESVPTAPDFFQPGHTYTRRDGTTFQCVAVTTHPSSGERLALGWHTDTADWTFLAHQNLGQWLHEYDGGKAPADGTEAGEAR